MTADPQNLPLTARRAPTRLLRGILLLLLSGLLMTLSFPAYSLWFLAPLCLVPFALCILRRPLNKWWLLIYYLFGTAWFTANLYWLIPVSLGGMLVLTFYCGLFWTLFAWGFHRLVVQLRWPALLALPVAWVATEYLRSTLLTGFPWFILGNALAPKLTFIQIADLGGVWLVTAFCTLTAGWLVDLLRLPLSQPTTKGPVFSGRILHLTAIYLTVTAATIGYGLFRLHQTTTVPGPRVSVIQENIPQFLKDAESAQEKQDVFDRHLSLSEQAAADHPDLLAWSETIITTPINPEWLDVDAYLARHDLVLTKSGQQGLARSQSIDKALADFSRKTGSSVLVGAQGRLPEDDEQQNIAILYTPEVGQTQPYYAKRHLVPFGEIVPFRDSWPWLHNHLLWMTGMGGDYTLLAGKEWTRFAISTPSGTPYKFGVPICYEDVMPYPSRAFVAPIAGKKQVDFLLSISNDGWYHSRDELDQHLQMDQLRAVENRVPIARSVNTGNSGFIDSTGRVMELVHDPYNNRYFLAGFATQTLPLDSRVTLYSRIGDLFPILFSILFGFSVAWTLLRPRRSASIAGHTSSNA